jgi:hypothetical protein
MTSLTVAKSQPKTGEDTRSGNKRRPSRKNRQMSEEEALEALALLVLADAMLHVSDLGGA